MKQASLIEKNLSRLRFLHTRAMKGERLYPEDIALIQSLKEKLQLALDAINDIAERLEND